MHLLWREKSSDEPSIGARGAVSVNVDRPQDGSDLPAEQYDRLFAQGKPVAQAVPSVSILALWHHATYSEKMWNLMGLAAAVCAGIAQPAMTIAFGDVSSHFVAFTAGFNNGTDGSRLSDDLTSSVDRNLLILVGIGAGMFVTTYAYSCIFQITGETVSRRVRERYLAAVLRQNIGYIESVGGGEVSTRITNDTNLFQAGISDKVPMLVQFVSMFLSGFIIAFIVNWRISIVLIAIVPAIMAAGAIMGAVCDKAKKESLEHLASAGTLAEEAISSLRTVQAFGTQDRMAALYDEPNALAAKSMIRFTVATAIGVGAFFFIVYSAYSLAFFWGTTGACTVSKVTLIQLMACAVFLDGNASVGNIITAFFSLVIGAFSLSECAPCIQAIITAASAAAKLYEIIERVPPIDSQSDTGLKLGQSQLKGDVEFRHVSFRYPARKEIAVLQDLSLHFPAGQTSALVGASGCGKTSIASILLRFYDPIDGQVLLDGTCLSDLHLGWLRAQIGLVSQDPVLFSATVYENVSYGLHNTPLEHAPEGEKRHLVEQACIKANADAFVRRLPAAYETRVGERGLLLSGGQRQRIAIARAIVSNPTLLILDEATSALDSKSEGIVQDALDKASQGRTVVMIAHRLSTVRRASRIFVIGSGEVLESGSHDELLFRKGPYYRLVAAQRVADLGTLHDEFEPDHGVSINAIDLQSRAHEKTHDVDEKAILAPEDDKQISIAMQILTDKVGAPNHAGRKYSLTVSVWRLLSMNAASWRYYALGIAGCCGVGCVYPVFSIIFGQIIGMYALPNADEIRSRANTLSGYLFAIACVAWVAMTFQIFGWLYSSVILGKELRLKAFRATIRQDVEFFDDERNSAGTLTANITDNAEQITALLGSTGGVIVQSFVTILVGVIVGLRYSWQIALVGVALLPFTFTTGLIRLYVVILKDSKNDAAHSQSAQLACESANAIRTVAALTRENDVVRLYSKEMDGPQQRTIRYALWGNALYAFSQASTLWCIALVVWYGSRLLITGNVSTTDFYIALEAVTFSSIDAGNVFMYVPDASKCVIAANSFFSMYDSRPKIDIDCAQGEKPNSTSGHLELKKVHFRYASRPHVPVLRGLSLDIKPGQTIALVGPSGCGKSTVIALLERFYDILSGSLTLDEREISELNVFCYRSFISLVAQESALYAGSVRTNILMGSARAAHEISQDELEIASRAANIHEFVSTLPDGYDTQLGGKGAQLSGGQRQRIALARALIRKPDILLLDEATSALDSESERIVQNALNAAARGRSTVAVAHRLSTVRNADCIYVFADGDIAESGTHAELYAKRRLYYELIQQQALEN